MSIELRTNEDKIKAVADLIHTHVETASNGWSNEVMGINCGCKSFIPFAEPTKEGGDYAYTLHLAEALSNAGLI